LRARQLDFENPFCQKARPCRQSDPEKDNRLPTQPAWRKSAPLCNPDCEQNQPKRKRSFSVKTFLPKTETAQALNAGKATEQAKPPARQLWRKTFEKCDQRQNEQIVNPLDSPMIKFSRHTALLSTPLCKPLTFCPRDSAVACSRG